VTDSYQTPTGIVSGIQWVPAEATHVLPQGAQPASAVSVAPTFGVYLELISSQEFSGSWNRGYLGKDDKLKEW
jgi:hypothetical protein